MAAAYKSSVSSPLGISTHRRSTSREAYPCAIRFRRLKRSLIAWSSRWVKRDGDFRDSRSFGRVVGLAGGWRLSDKS